jgi:hypothetical protein
MTDTITIDTLDQLYNTLDGDEQTFVNEYLTNGYSQTAAAAKITRPGTTYASQRVRGSLMYHRPNIKAYIDAFHQLKAQERDLKINRLEAELEKHAYMSLGDQPDSDLTRLKIKSMELLSRHLGMNEKPAVSVTDTEGKTIKVEYC